jgi:hypothetical protein
LLGCQSPYAVELAIEEDGVVACQVELGIRLIGTRQSGLQVSEGPSTVSHIPKY